MLEKSDFPTFCDGAHHTGDMGASHVQYSEYYNVLYIYIHTFDLVVEQLNCSK